MFHHFALREKHTETKRDALPHPKSQFRTADFLGQQNGLTNPDLQIALPCQAYLPMPLLAGHGGHGTLRLSVGRRLVAVVHQRS